MKIPFKIISGGQTGVDRAAVDAAVTLGIEYGGSIPKGRKAEDGSIPHKYDKFTELNSATYSARTEQNITDADATLIFIYGKPTGGTALTIELAEKHKKPCLVIDFKKGDSNKIIDEAVKWLSKLKPAVLNVAGARESTCPGIYLTTFDMLRMIMTRYLKKISNK